MKRQTFATRLLVAALIASGALIAASGATATYADEPRHGADVHVTMGWHGERYWDGHRYWAHDEWMRNHPHDRDPNRHHDH